MICSYLLDGNQGLKLLAAQDDERLRASIAGKLSRNRGTDPSMESGDPSMDEITMHQQTDLYICWKN